MLFYSMLYYTILYYTILYYTILYYTILYYTILHYTILYYTILYYTILYYTILYYTILNYADHYHRQGSQKPAAMHGAPQARTWKNRRHHLRDHTVNQSLISVFLRPKPNPYCPYLGGDAEQIEIEN